MSAARFELMASEGAARRGRLHTAHGVVDTPAFMPVGTAATVKAMFTDTVAATGAQMILANTYHLMLRPGAERIAKFGGVRQFMGWTGPMLTDSGGYQVMSLAKLRKIDDGGVTFQSHIDGSKHYLSPERSIDIQYLLDATVTMAFDECTPYPATKDEVAESTQLSMRWAERSKPHSSRAKATPCSVLCRAAFMPICALNRRPSCKPSALMATPLAAWRWAKGRS